MLARIGLMVSDGLLSRFKQRVCLDYSGPGYVDVGGQLGSSNDDCLDYSVPCYIDVGGQLGSKY